MERSWLICALLGKYCEKEKNITSEDLKYKIDEYLIESKFTPLGSEPSDLQMLDEMIGELIMSSVGRGFNRQDRRRVKK